jgi:rubrerythrin
MSILFNADEIFTIAERIEENGARFYRRAAENLMEPDVSGLLIELAVKEDEHREVFASMRRNLAKSGAVMVVDPDNELLADYLNAWADINVFREENDPLQMLTGDETVEDILHMAIDAEKDSIVFYLGMKETLPGSPDRSKVDRIIWEEMSHYAALSTQLAERERKVN